MNDMQQYTGPALVNPFERGDMPAHVNAGTVMIEQERAIAEVKGKLSVAKMFPRNEAVAFQKVMDSCSRKSLAEVATYSFPRGGKTVSGPSIRLAEELARCWGNLDYGMRELSRKEGVSEMEAYAWDMETNTISAQRFTVNHIRDKSEGGSKVTSERDIYELTANQASRRVRERIFAILPPDLIDAALQRCRQTLAGNADTPIADRVRAMIAAFNKFGVSAQMIEKRLGRPLDQMLPEDFADYTGIRNSLKDGNTTVADWFGGDAPALSGPSAPATNDNQAAQQPQQPAARRGRQAKAAEQQQTPAAGAAENAASAPAAQEPAQAPEQAAQAPQQEQPAAPAPTLAQPSGPSASGNLNEVF